MSANDTSGPSQDCSLDEKIKHPRQMHRRMVNASVAYHDEVVSVLKNASTTAKKRGGKLTGRGELSVHSVTPNRKASGVRKVRQRLGNVRSDVQRSTIEKRNKRINSVKNPVHTTTIENRNEASEVSSACIVQDVDRTVTVGGSSTFVTSDNEEIDCNESYQFSDIETQK